MKSTFLFILALSVFEVSFKEQFETKEVVMENGIRIRNSDLLPEYKKDEASSKKNWENSLRNKLQGSGTIGRF